MPLRKKTVKTPKENESRISSILSRKRGQAYVKPSYSQSEVDLRPLPALPPSSPLFNSPTHSSIFAPLNDTPSPRRRKQHRRSRSFSALSPSKTLAAGLNPSPSLRVSTAPTYDPFANLNAGRDAAAAQPWRSRETWQALHSPIFKPTVVKERPYGEAGWRGNGAFFAGSQDTLITVKSVHRPLHKAHENQVSVKTSQTSTTSLRGSPSIPSRQSSLRLPQRSIPAPIDWSSPSRRPSLNTGSNSRIGSSISPISPSRRSSEHTITSSDESSHSHICTPISETPNSGYGAPSIAKAPSTPQRSSDPPLANGSDDEDALLPPLTPKSILKCPSRSNSFAQLPVGGSTPVPWGKRGSYPHQPLSRSTTPAPTSCTPYTPAPVSRSRSGSVSRVKSSAPHRALPRPPPDVPNSPELDFSTIKPIFPPVQSSRKLQAAFGASHAMPRSTSEASLPRQRSRSGSMLTHESSESKDSSASVKIMTPRTDSSGLSEQESQDNGNFDLDAVAALPSPNKRAGMMFARTPSPRKGSIGGRGLSSAGSSMSLASVKSVERGGWL